MMSIVNGAMQMEHTHILYYSSYLGKIKHLEMKVKQLEKKQRGAMYMSKLINSLVGNFMTAAEALQYGLIDQVIEKR